MVQLTASEFVDRVRRSGLVDESRLNLALEKTETSEGDSGLLSAQLVDAGLLTPWQSKQLLAGRSQGFILGKYKVLDKLGKGGMSNVFLAEHMQMGRRVAIKVLAGRMAEQADVVNRFKHEARAAARVDHPNIVRAFDVDEEDGIHYLVMEYIEGVDLQQYVLDNGPVSSRTAADLIRQSAVGLSHVHRTGLIHRDIKPANLLLERGGTVKIVDLGLARLPEGDRGSLQAESGEQIMGTVDYLAPEQSFDSDKVTAQTDIYCLGCTLYFLLTGQSPFPEGSFVERIRKHRSEEPRPIFDYHPLADPTLVSICGRMMAKRPADRFQSADDVVESLQFVLDSRSVRLYERVERTAATAASHHEMSDAELTLAPLDEDTKPVAAAGKSSDAASFSSESSHAKSPENSGIGAKKSLPRASRLGEEPRAQKSPQSSSSIPTSDLLDELFISEVHLPSVEQISSIGKKTRDEEVPRWVFVLGGLGIATVVLLGLAMVFAV